MTEMGINYLNGVAETLFLTTYIRALESQRPDALLRDEKAVALVSQMGYDFSRFTKVKMDENDKLAIILRNREFDRFARDFIIRNPEAVVVHIGCGLDTRFERVDNGSIEWYDLDLPEVIDLRRKLIGSEGSRYHLLACSVFDDTWHKTLNTHNTGPFLFMAEGVLMYFEEAQVRSLVHTLQDNFPGAELVYDAFSPFIVRANNLRLRISSTKIDARYQWGPKNGREVESWGNGIRLLDLWGVFDCQEPRLTYPQWVRRNPLFANAIRIFHYSLNPSETAAVNTSMD